MQNITTYANQIVENRAEPNLIDVESRSKMGLAVKRAADTFPTLAWINLPETISPFIVVVRRLHVNSY